jgi:hypothetical protein
MQRRQTLVLLGMGLLAAGGCKKEPTATSADADSGAPAASAAATAPAEQILALLGQFEGEIDLSMTSHEGRAAPAQPITMNLLIKSGKVRADVPEKIGGGTGLGPGAYFILDASAKKLEIVSDAQKHVFVVDFNTSGDKLKALGGAHHGPAHEEPKTSVTKTGKTETVAGRKCEDWDVVSDHRQGTACVAEEDVSWFQIPMSGLPSKHAWAAELLDGKHLPLRFIGYAKDGSTEENRVEVTKIDKKSLPAAEFEYPPDYAVSDFAQLFAGLAGMRGGMPPGMPGGIPPGMPAGLGIPPGMVPPPRQHQ